jgi:hypothetical protein
LDEEIHPRRLPQHPRKRLPNEESTVLLEAVISGLLAHPRKAILKDLYEASDELAEPLVIIGFGAMLGTYSVQ